MRVGIRLIPFFSLLLNSYLTPSRTFTHYMANILYISIEQDLSYLYTEMKDYLLDTLDKDIPLWVLQLSYEALPVLIEEERPGPCDLLT